MNRGIVSILLPILLFVAACGGGDDGSGFTADPGPIDPALAPALAEGVNVEAVPSVQRNFLELCVEGTSDDAPELAALQQQGLVAVCGCTYDTLVSELRDDADSSDTDERDRQAYDEFRRMERDLRVSGDLDPLVRTIVADCIRDEAGL